MPAGSWLRLLILVFLAGAAFEMPWLVYFSIAVTCVMGVAHWWRTHALDRVGYTRRIRYTRGFPGESSPLSLTVENRKPLPLSWLRVSDPWPLAVAPDDEKVLAPSNIQTEGTLVNVYALRWYDRVQRTFNLLFRERGVHPVGPAQLESGDLFGVYSNRVELPRREYLTVFPEMLPLDLLRLKAADPFGERVAARPLYEDPTRPIGVRPYHPEDGFRRIHWPATARTGELQTRVFQPVSSRMVAVFLNVATSHQPWLGYSPPLLEYMISACATLVFQGVQSGYAVGLYANGCMAHSDQPFRLQPGRTPAHLGALLQALAAVTPYVTGPFDKFLVASLAEIPFGTSLVVVTSLFGEALQDSLLRLRRYRPSLTVYLAGPIPPPDLPGIRTAHLPFEESLHV